jgi:hypothetical protein
MLHTSNPIKAVIAATPTTRIECSLFLRAPAAPALRRLIDDPTCMILPAPSSQSSQIGPHLVQPPSARQRAIKPATTATPRNMVNLSPSRLSYGVGSGLFKQARSRVSFAKARS